MVQLASAVWRLASLVPHRASSTTARTMKMKNNAIVGAVSRFSKSVSLFQKVQKTVEAQVQHICWIVDMTVCHNIKTAIQTVWSSGGTSDSVVIEWWTSLCDAKTGRLCSVAGLLSRSFRIFRIVPESRVSVGQKIHAGSSSNGHLLGKPRKSPVRDWRQALEKICAHRPPAHADAAAGADSKDSTGPQRHKNEHLFQE